MLEVLLAACIGAFVLMIVGLYALFAYMRRRRAAASEAPIDDDARARAAALLARNDRDTPQT